MKTTIIELLNKIANGEEVPKKIQYYDKYEEYSYTFTLEEDNNYYSKELGGWLFTSYDIQKILNDEVEILETEVTINQDKKIEKLEQRIDTGLIGSETLNMIEHTNRINRQANYISDIVAKINEIIEALNER